MHYKPSIHMVPGPLWNLNLRNVRVIPQSRWNKIRAEFFDAHGTTCQTCGKIETERKRLHVHEEWEYLVDQKPAIAKLARLQISCWHCHMIEHFGWLIRMVVTGKPGQQAIDDTIDHFCRTNKVGRSEFDRHFSEAKEEWMRLSQLEWTIDWGEFGSLVEETATKRRKRRQKQQQQEEWEEDEDEDEDGEEDQALYEWPYLHSGEPW